MEIMSPVTVFEKFQSHSDGLSDREATYRLEKFGPNVIRGKRKKPLILQFLEEFTDLMVLILLGAAALTYFFKERGDAIVIFSIVLLNAVIGFVQKFKAERAIEALKKLLTPKARVLRDNKAMVIDVRNIVPGDILVLSEGDKVSADALIVENHELAIDESILTGESVPVRKKAGMAANRDSCIYMGTQITHGGGRAVVLATGMRTEFGKIASLTTETKKDKSPLQKELHDIGILVGKITLGISLVLIAVGYFLHHKPFVETLVFAASVAVAAVPEGLPATVTIALALGVQRLAKNNAIMKQLASVETLGSTTVICSDKTGTLTKNEMTVREAFFKSQHATISGVGYEPVGAIHIHGKMEQNSREQLESLCLIAGLCNNAHLYRANERWVMIGDPTEGALLTLAEKAGFPIDDLKKRYKKLFEIPFDSERKRMTVIVREESSKEDSSTKKVYALTKGAPETVLPLCGLTEIDHEALRQKNEEMANRALRVMAFAMREIPSDLQRTYESESVEKDLQFCGMAGMIDPPREEAKEAVKMAQKAGIKVYIVTGDNGLTASAVAKELGLVGNYQVRILTGADLDKITDEKLQQLFQEHADIIFSRVNPSHKLRIVSALKTRGEVVAVTGDGVNDAPAIKRADIGIAMGLTGTDVTREAANMVLADDSFATIVIAVREGRVIYENLKKFIFYIFSSNIGELVAIFIPLVLFFPSPLSSVLILAVNVGTDLLPALALSVDPPETDIMNKKPRHPASRIMNVRFVGHYVSIGFCVGIVVLAGYLWQLRRLGWQWGEELLATDYRTLASMTFAFALLVAIQMVNALNARSDHQSIFSMGVFSNKKLWGAILISMAVTVLFIQVPFLGRFLNVVPLDGKTWALLGVLSLSVLAAEEIRKWIMRVRRPV